MRLAIVCTSISVVAAVVLGVLVRRDVLAMPSFDAIRNVAIVYFALMVAFLLMHAISYRLIRWRARKSIYQLCTNCLYALDGLPDRHRCPECGAEYDREKTRELWSAWLKETEFRVK